MRGAPRIELQVAADASGSGRAWREQFVSFEVTKTRSAAPNKAKIEIFNLGLESVRYVESARFARLLVDGVQLFAGDIRAKGTGTRQSGPDRITTLQCGDGRAALTTASVALSYPAGTLRSAAVRDAVAATGLPVRGVLPDDGQAFEWGWSFAGRAAAVLDEFAPGWSVQDGAVDFGGTSGRTTVRLAEGSGLIGSPERTDKGVKIKCVLSPALQPHGIVAVASTFVSGYYRIRELTHRGDSRGTTWETALTCGAELG